MAEREIVRNAAYLTPNWWLFEAILSGLAGFLFIYLYLICPYIRYGIIWAMRMKAQTEKRLHRHRGRPFFEMVADLFLPPGILPTQSTNTSSHPEVRSPLLSGNLFAWHNTIPSDIKRQQADRGTVGITNNIYYLICIEHLNKHQFCSQDCEC